MHFVWYCRQADCEAASSAAISFGPVALATPKGAQDHNHDYNDDDSAPPVKRPRVGPDGEATERYDRGGTTFSRSSGGGHLHGEGEDGNDGGDHCEVEDSDGDDSTADDDDNDAAADDDSDDDDDDDDDDDEEDDDGSRSHGGDDVLYLMFTSGSSGTPKCVAGSAAGTSSFFHIHSYIRQNVFFLCYIN